MAVEVDLFGNEVEVQGSKPAVSSRPPVNNMALVETVLRRAAGQGYVLAGTAQRVRYWYRDDEARKVTDEIEQAVHQLIDAGWLTVGGKREARLGAHHVTVRAVSVPRKTRQTLSRWQHLVNPWQQQERGTTA